MRSVSRDEFFATVGSLDVHPRVDVSTLKDRWHESDWETPQRQRLGRTRSDSWGVEPTRYWVEA